MSVPCSHEALTFEFKRDLRSVPGVLRFFSSYASSTSIGPE